MNLADSPRADSSAMSLTVYSNASSRLHIPRQCTRYVIPACVLVVISAVVSILNIKVVEITAPGTEQIQGCTASCLETQVSMGS